MNYIQETPTVHRSERSLLAALRGLIPNRKLTLIEVQRLAELQANRLRELTGADSASLAEAIAAVPRVRVEYRRLPTSGLSFWDGTDWVIGINRDEPDTRQRFTLLHEFKHILDHRLAARMFVSNERRTAEQQAEQVADYFAGCALMPKSLLKRAWGNGVQTPDALAALFDASARAVEVRLAQIGLSEPIDRCDATPHFRPRGRYFRQLSTTAIVSRSPDRNREAQHA
jgi:Zn-dependent peptidase ImmA (M78 family)